MTVLEAALAYAARGWSVVPCEGKAATLARNAQGEGGARAATNDAERIRRWFAKWPGANLGIVAGPSGLLVLDIDTKGGDGHAELLVLEDELGQLPPTYTVQTPSGGAHYYFVAPSGVQITASTRTLAPNIDIRAGWTYVVAPPSAGYEIAVDVEPAELPEAWIERIERLRAPERAARPEPPRIDTRSPDQLERRAVAYLHRMPPAISGQGGHDATFRAAVALARGFGLDEDTTFRLLAEHYNPRCQPPWSERELRHKARSATEAHVPLGYLLEGDAERAEARAYLADDAPPPTDEDAPPEARAKARPTVQPASWLDALSPIGAEVFAEPPPPKEWLLSRTDEETGESIGVLERGIVGALVAPGGRGKSWALAQLSIAVALGTQWLDAFNAEHVGNVLLAMAEESAEEARRRLYAVGRALGLSPAQQRLAGERIYALGLRGTNVSIVETDRSGAVFPSPTHAAMMERLAAPGREWALVILDPLSRWAPGVETANAAATVAVELLEVFTTLPGKPTVIVAHHTAKASRRLGNKSGQSASRGVSGLTDAWRWEAQLTGSTETDLAIACEKANGARKFPTVELVRDESGVLRRASALEVAERSEREARKQAEDDQAVLKVIEANPGIGTVALRTKLRGVLGNEAIGRAVRRLLEAGQVEDRTTGRAHAYYISAHAQLPEPAARQPEAAGPGTCPAAPTVKWGSRQVRQSGEWQANPPEEGEVLGAA